MRQLLRFAVAVLALALAPGLSLALVGEADADVGSATGGRTPPRGTIAYVDGPGVLSIRADGTRRRLLVTGGAAPAWSPDGRRLAVADELVRLYDAAGGTGSPVGPAAGLCDTPSWAPDGRRLACVGPTDDRNELVTDAFGIFLQQVGTGRETRLAAVVDEFAGPAWAPDGRRLSYSDARGRLRLLDLQTGRTDPVGPGTSADWSPSGGLLAYSTGHAIVVSRPDGSRRRTIVRSRDTLEQPSWSPDGRWLAYAVFTGEGWSDPTSRGIRIVSAAGGAPRVLTHTGYDPDWRAG